MADRARPLLLSAQRPSPWTGIAVGLAAVATATALVYALKGVAPEVSLGVVYLPAVLLVSAYWGLWLGLFTFRIENLSALREVALRQVAEEVEAKRLTTELVGSGDQLAQDVSNAVGERLLALVEPYPRSQRLVRRAWRSAQRPPSGRLTEDAERGLGALRQLASVLGAHMLVEESDEVAMAIADVARRRGTTYILMGRARPARGLGRLRTPLPQRLMELLPGVDVRIVADRAQRQADSGERER
jgi:two-component system sensor histidine kinase KdpD